MTQINTTKMWLVYEAENGKFFFQPWEDIVESGTLIDPDTDDNMDCIGWTTGP